MIDEEQGRIDYDESGSGPAVVLLPGCSTGAAWRPVIAAWRGQFRSITTSLLGYGGTRERRTAGNPSIHTTAKPWSRLFAEPAVGYIWSAIPLAASWRWL